MHVTRPHGRRGLTAPALLGLSALLLSAAPGAHADTITFGNLPGPAGTIDTGSYSEGNFTVNFGSTFVSPVATNVPRPWQSGSNVSSSQYIFTAAPNPNTTGYYNSIEVKLTGGGLFTFSSVDLANGGAVGYYFIGRTGGPAGAIQFGNPATATGTLTAPGGFQTVNNSNSSSSIDDLVIGLTGGGNTSSFSLDNIVLTPQGGTGGPTATPEPSSWAAFGFTGLGALALMFKARRRKALSAV